MVGVVRPPGVALVAGGPAADGLDSDPFAAILAATRFPIKSRNAVQIRELEAVRMSSSRGALNVYLRVV